MFTVIDVPFENNGEIRKSFIIDDDELINFKKGERVLPAVYASDELINLYHVFFRKKHEPGTPLWPNGGYECYDINGGFRAFALDALIKYPTDKKTIKKAVIKPKFNGNPGKRGRKRKYEIGQSPQELYQKQLEERRANGEKITRGRKPNDPNKPLGRVRKHEIGQSPYELNQKSLDERRKNGEIIRRGRPKKL